jgi:DprA winged helix domain
MTTTFSSAATKPTAGRPSIAQQQPHETIGTLSRAIVPFTCVCLAAELAVADQIGDEPVSVDELASRCSADADALDRVLACWLRTTSSAAEPPDS